MATLGVTDEGRGVFNDTLDEIGRHVVVHQKLLSDGLFFRPVVIATTDGRLYLVIRAAMAWV